MFDSRTRQAGEDMIQALEDERLAADSTASSLFGVSV
jgi:hypothetical protein